jgi:hypothetical protein
MAKECDLYDRFCIECGECEICDLDNSKKCDNCSNCIGDTGEFRVLKVDDFLKESVKKTYKLKKIKEFL